MVPIGQADFPEKLSRMLRCFSPPSSKRWWEDEDARTAACHWICKPLRAGRVAEAGELYWRLLELEQWEQEDQEGPLSTVKRFIIDWLMKLPDELLLAAEHSLGRRQTMLEMAQFVASRRFAVDQLVAQGDLPGMQRMERAAEVSA